MAVSNIPSPHIDISRAAVLRIPTFISRAPSLHQPSSLKYHSLTMRFFLLKHQPTADNIQNTSILFRKGYVIITQFLYVCCLDLSCDVQQSCWFTVPLFLTLCLGGWDNLTKRHVIQFSIVAVGCNVSFECPWENRSLCSGALTVYIRSPGCTHGIDAATFLY